MCPDTNRVVLTSQLLLIGACATLKATCYVWHHCSKCGGLMGDTVDLLASEKIKQATEKHGLHEPLPFSLQARKVITMCRDDRPDSCNATRLEQALLPCIAPLVCLLEHYNQIAYLCVHRQTDR